MLTGLIFVVRHAQSAAKAGQRTTDQATIPITALGVCQAQCVAGVIPVRPGVVAVSSYLRSVQTGEPLLRRFPGLTLDQWPVEEFTYLDPGACHGTTYAERASLRDSYWNRCDPAHVDGPGCESFAGFIARVGELERRLGKLPLDGMTVVITHGFVMKALLWLQLRAPAPIGQRDMAEFDNFHRGVSVPNCAILRANLETHGRLDLSVTPSVDHLPAELQTA